MATLRDNDRAALMKLLADDDATVLQLLEAKFREMGPDGMAFLESAARDGSPDTQRGARQILQTLREHEVFESFASFCARAGNALDLETGCFLLARTRYPDLDVAPYSARLDEMARELRARLTGREMPLATIEVCNRYLFRRLGFRGNTDDYYDADNSYLNRVLDRRLGIPISLAVVYLLVGKRLGFPLVGINMPGHFLIAWQRSNAPLLIDAFNEGRVLDTDDCKTLCEHLGHPFRPAYLQPASSRQLLLRMCHNLRAVYAESDPPRAEQLGRFIALLSRS